MKFKEKFIKFMSGRNGFDAITYALGIVYIILAVINLFVSSSIIYATILLICIYIIVRVFSRNLSKRRSENQKFLSLLKKIKSWFKVFGLRFKERKTHIYKKCPHCKNTLRLPKIQDKQTHTVNCPCCNQKFDM